MNKEQTVYVVDDDEGVREGVCLLLKTVGHVCRLFSSATDFLDAYDQNMSGCLVLDIRMKEMSGLTLQDELVKLNSTLPIIFITGHGDIPMAVKAMRNGALDFIRKPFREQDLLDSINQALELNETTQESLHDHNGLKAKVDSLSERENEVFNGVANGEMNKVISHKLGISQRTVEVHRASIMKKLGADTLAELVRIKIITSMSNK